MNGCIFCKIIKGEIPSSKIYEDNNVLAFLDIRPVNKGHTLVIPKDHHETMLEIPDELSEKLIIAVRKVMAAVKKGANADGISLSMSNYRAAGQVVPHAHFHIIPRYENDGLKLWPQCEYKEGEMEKTKEKIVGFL